MYEMLTVLFLGKLIKLIWNDKLCDVQCTIITDCYKCYSKIELQVVCYAFNYSYIFFFIIYFILCKVQLNNCIVC